MDSLTPSKLQEVDVSQNLVNGEWTTQSEVFIYHEGTIFVYSWRNVQLSEVRNSGIQLPIFWGKKH